MTTFTMANLTLDNGAIVTDDDAQQDTYLADVTGMLTIGSRLTVDITEEADFAPYQVLFQYVSTDTTSFNNLQNCTTTGNLYSSPQYIDDSPANSFDALLPGRPTPSTGRDRLTAHGTTSAPTGPPLRAVRRARSGRTPTSPSSKARQRPSPSPPVSRPLPSRCSSWGRPGNLDARRGRRWGTLAARGFDAHRHPGHDRNRQCHGCRRPTAGKPARLDAPAHGDQHLRRRDCG